MIIHGLGHCQWHRVQYHTNKKQSQRYDDKPTISWPVASKRVQRTQLQYLSMAITMTNRKTISRPMIAWRREIFVTDKYEDNDRQQMQYLSMTIVLQTKRQYLGLG